MTSIPFPTAPTRTQDGVSYSFRGWWTLPKGGETITEKDDISGKYVVTARVTQEMVNNGPVTFYAQWSKRLNVTLDGNGYGGNLGGVNTWWTATMDTQLKSVTDNLLKFGGSSFPAGKDFGGWVYQECRRHPRR